MLGYYSYCYWINRSSTKVKRERQEIKLELIRLIHHVSPWNRKETELRNVQGQVRIQIKIQCNA